MKCSVTNSKGVQCDRETHGKAELCAGHKTRQARWGDVFPDRPLRPYTPAKTIAPAKYLTGDTPEQRFYSQVDKADDHWWWTGGIIENSGYGQVALWGTPQTANRAAWQLAYGEVPEGVRIAQTCGHKLCVRLSHLEARYLDGTPCFEFSPEELLSLAGV